MKCLVLPVVSACLVAVAPLMAAAQDYEQAVKAALFEFAPSGAHKDVVLDVACPHTPAIDFIQSHAALFEEQTGASVRFSFQGEAALRARIADGAANKTGATRLYCLDAHDIPSFASKQWIQPIGTAIKSSLRIQDVFDTLKSSYSWQGKLFGLPIQSDVSILYFRKDILGAAGVGVPKTLDELEAAAARLKQEQTSGIALRGRRGESMNVAIWVGWLRGYGGNFLDPAMKPVFDSDAAVTGTQHYADLVRDFGPSGSGTWGIDDVASAFGVGSVAMTVESSSLYPAFNDPKTSAVTGRVGYAPFPAGPKGSFPAVASVGFAVSSTVPAARPAFAAATDFIQWATSQQMEFARTARDIGGANRRSVYASALILSKVDPDYVKAVGGALATATPQCRPLIPEWREMGDIIGARIEAALTGNISVHDALAAASRETQALFAAQGVAGRNRPYQELFPDTP